MSSIRCCKHKIFQLFALSCCFGKALVLKWVKLSFWPFIHPGLWTRLSQVIRLLLQESFLLKEQVIQPMTQSLNGRRIWGFSAPSHILHFSWTAFQVSIMLLSVDKGDWLLEKKIRLWIKWEALSFEEYRINRLTCEKLASYQDNTGIQWTPLGTKTHQYVKWFLIWCMIFWT